MGELLAPALPSICLEYTSHLYQLNVMLPYRSKFPISRKICISLNKTNEGIVQEKKKTKNSGHRKKKKVETLKPESYIKYL